MNFLALFLSVSGKVRAKVLFVYSQAQILYTTERKSCYFGIGKKKNRGMGHLKCQHIKSFCFCADGGEHLLPLDLLDSEFKRLLNSYHKQKVPLRVHGENHCWDTIYLFICHSLYWISGLKTIVWRNVKGEKYIYF